MNQKLKLGFIPMSVQETLGANWDKTLERLSTAGYQGIELHAVAIKTTGQTLFDATEMSPAAMRRSLDAHGLECPSWFAGWGDFGDKTEQTLEIARNLGASYIVWGWAPPQDPDLMAKAEPAMHAAAEAVREAGMTLIYHNHDHEFTNDREGHCAYDWLMDRFDPTALQAELDVGWVAYGGHDIVATIRRHPDRIPILHLRDIANLDKRGDFVEVGEGMLDLPSILETGIQSGGSRWGVVEHTPPLAMDPVDGLILAAENLKKSGLFD
ncbi:MAG: sugar phosphate isomerase/epimerase family protein [Opitutales bacterium]